MTSTPAEGEGRRIRLSISPRGEITAKTIGFVGEECLDEIPILEDLLGATTVSSTLTEDYHRAAQRHSSHQQDSAHQDARRRLDGDVDGASAGPRTV